MQRHLALAAALAVVAWFGCAQVPAPSTAGPASSARGAAPSAAATSVSSADVADSEHIDLDSLGGLQLTVRPADASVGISGEPVRLYGGKSTQLLPAGEYVVEVSHRKHGLVERSVEVIAGQDVTVEIDLSRQDEIEEPALQQGASSADRSTAGDEEDAPTPFAGILLGVVGLAIGGTGIAVGVIFLVESADRDSSRDELIDETVGWPDICDSYQASASVIADCNRIDDLEDEAATRRDLGLGLVVAGGVVALLGVGLMLLLPPSLEQDGSQAHLQVQPYAGLEGGGLGLRGTF
jgi:hypothetical protein